MRARATARPTRSTSATSRRLEEIVEVLAPVARRAGGAPAGGGLGGISRADAAPRRLAAVLDRAFDGLRAHFALLFPVAVLALLPGLLVQQLGNPIQNATSATSLLGFLLSTIAGAWIGMIGARAMAFTIVGRSVPARTLLRFTPRELLGLLLISLVTGVLLFFGFLTLIGWIFVLWWFSLAPSVYVLEPHNGRGLGVFATLRRSGSLIDGSFPRWSGANLVLGVLFLLSTWPTAALQAPELRELLADALGTGLGQAEALLGLLMVLPSAFTLLVGAFVYASFYVDQRARLEGVDLYIAMEALERS